ncbi:MAG: RepB family DNA primase [Anaerolineae bacterium]|nr:RepB family DNA primase [Anaerolineae bacterium]
MNNPKLLHEVLQRLLAANRAGWGAYFAVGLRRHGLGRWRRGTVKDVVALPALFVDLDDPSSEALTRLRHFPLPPSCIVDSGGGFHAYWWLSQPATDLEQAAYLLRALSSHLCGDTLSVAQSLRLPQTRNTKPNRGGLCHVMDLGDHHYTLKDFERLLPIREMQFSEHEKPYRTAQTVHTLHNRQALNPKLIDVVTESLRRDYDGYLKENGYLAALCPCGHQHDAQGKHFNFDPAHGIGTCFGKHGRLLLRDLCTLLKIDPAAYGGFYLQEESKLV